MNVPGCLNGGGGVLFKTTPNTGNFLTIFELHVAPVVTPVELLVVKWISSVVQSVDGAGLVVVKLIASVVLAVEVTYIGPVELLVVKYVAEFVVPVAVVVTKSVEEIIRHPLPTKSSTAAPFQVA